MADERHEARRAIAAWKVARYEAKIAAAVRAALATQRAKLPTYRPGTPPGDPFDLATWDDTVQAHVGPAAHSVLSDIAHDVGKAAGLGAIGAIIGRALPDGTTVGEAVAAGADRITAQASAIGQGLSDRIALTISTATDNGALASSMNSLFNAADVQGALVARSANFFANGLAQQAALTVTDEAPLQKTWVTMGDDRVRPDHDDVDGTTIPADEPFDVGGEALMYPGDPAGSDAEVANCRCWLAFEPVPGGGGSSDGESAPVEPDEALAAAGSVTAQSPRRHTLRVSAFPPRNRAERRQAAKRARSKR